MKRGYNRCFIQLMFDGSNYHGWQFQPNAITVQEVVEKSLKTLFGEEVSVMGCGRTDTGVHASDFYLHCDLPRSKFNDEELKYKMNHLMPIEVAVKAIYHLGDQAHARFDAVSREYRYYLHQDKNPFIQQNSYFFARDLNLESMRSAGNSLLKHKDFTSFSKLHTDVKTNFCDVSLFEINLLPDGRIEIVIVANRFLRNMVRSIVGTLLEVGVGKLSFTDFTNIVNSKNRSNAGASAPAKGLFLYKVNYPTNYFEKDNGN